MKNKCNVFNALPIVAAHYGDKFGVRVVVKGNDAYTDKKVIVVPNVADDYPHKKVIWGYLVHEAGHVRHTDFDVWMEAAQSGSSLRKSLLNVIEDFRVEQAMINAYPGVNYDLKQTVTYVKEQGQFQAVNAQSHPGEILHAKVLFWLRSKLLGQPLEALENTAESAMQVAFNEGVNTRLAVLLRKAVNATSTQDCLDLTDSILKMLEEEEKEEKTRNSSNDDANKDSGDSDERSEDLQDDDVADCETSSEDSPEEVSCDTDDRVNDTQNAQNIRKALDSGEDDLAQDVFEALKEDLFEQADGAGNEEYCTVPFAPSADENPRAGKEMLNTVRSTTTRLRAQLMGLVQSSRIHQDRAAYNGRRLYSSYLHRVLSGDARLYRKREQREAPNTSVHILTDFSGSMSGQSCVVASHSSLAIALALETIQGVNPAVTYFGGDAENPVRAIVKHGQSINKQAKCFPQSVWGCTPMAEAIWYAAFELSKTAENRKVLLVITDGDPDNEAATHKVLDLCRNAGIEALGIGIAQRGVERFFDRSVVIESVDELQQTLFRLMQDTLTVQVA